MTKKIMIFVGLGILILISSIIYWFYFAKPTAFPSNDQLLKEINHSLPEASADVIQDIVYVDDRHVVVPFISKEKGYGLSYWVWQKHKWTAASITSDGEPVVWKLEKNDPSTYHLVWNFHPNDEISYLKFYLKRDRGYQISNGIENYFPGVQIEQKVSLQGNSYGVLQLPEEWISFIDPLINLESAKQPNSFDFFVDNYLYFGWVPYDKTDLVVRPNWGGSAHSFGFSGGSVDIDFVRFLDEMEIESP
jgi:hypothetical protein